MAQALVVCDLGSEAHLDNLKKINVLRGAQSNSLIEYSIQNYQVAHALHQMAASTATLKKGFAYTQKMKAQQLWLSLLKTEAAGFAKIPKPLLEAERDLQLNIQYYERKVLEARENKDTAALNKYENNLLFESRKAYADLVQKMEEEHPAYFEAKYAFEAAFKQQLERDFQFVHIAGHSFADIENPKFSGIACFDEAIDSKEDGILYTGEIYALAAKADLVTLSSCESGFGKLDRTEGLLGLNRAFIYAGSPNVVFSLWKVYDKVSAELMVDFYGQILAGKDYPEALRQAKLNLLNRETTAAPHFWSPYLLIGR